MKWNAAQHIRRVGMLLLIASLSRTWAAELKSVKDREAAPLPAGAKILVFADVDGIATVESIESQLVDRLHKKFDVEAVSAASLFPPTRTFSVEDRAKIVVDAGITVVLRIIVTGSQQLTKDVTVVTSPWTAVS